MSSHHTVGGGELEERRKRYAQRRHGGVSHGARASGPASPYMWTSEEDVRLSLGTGSSQVESPRRSVAAQEALQKFSQSPRKTLAASSPWETSLSESRHHAGGNGRSPSSYRLQEKLRESQSELHATRLELQQAYDLVAELGRFAAHQDGAAEPKYDTVETPSKKGNRATRRSEERRGSSEAASAAWESALARLESDKASLQQVLQTLHMRLTSDDALPPDAETEKDSDDDSDSSDSSSRSPFASHRESMASKVVSRVDALLDALQDARAETRHTAALLTRSERARREAEAGQARLASQAREASQREDELRRAVEELQLSKAEAERARDAAVASVNNALREEQAAHQQSLAAMDDMAEEMTQLQAELQEQRAEKEALQQAVAVAREEKEALETKQWSVTSQSAEVEALQSRVASMTRDAEDFQKTIDRLRAEVQSAHSKLSDVEEERDAAAEHEEALLQHLQRAKARETELLKTVRQLSLHVQGEDDSVPAALQEVPEARRLSVRDAAVETDSRGEAEAVKLTVVQQQLERAEQAKASLEHKLREVNVTLTSYQRDQEASSAREETLSSRIASLETNIRSAEDERDSLASTVEAFRDDFAKIQSEKAATDASLARVQASLTEAYGALEEEKRVNEDFSQKEQSARRNVEAITAELKERSDYVAQLERSLWGGEDSIERSLEDSKERLTTLLHQVHSSAKSGGDSSHVRTPEIPGRSRPRSNSPPVMPAGWPQAPRASAKSGGSGGDEGNADAEVEPVQSPTLPTATRSSRQGNRREEAVCALAAWVPRAVAAVARGVDHLERTPVRGMEEDLAGMDEEEQLAADVSAILEKGLRTTTAPDAAPEEPSRAPQPPPPQQPQNTSLVSAAGLPAPHRRQGSLAHRQPPPRPRVARKSGPASQSGTTDGGQTRVPPGPPPRRVSRPMAPKRWSTASSVSSDREESSAGGVGDTSGPRLVGATADVPKPKAKEWI